MVSKGGSSAPHDDSDLEDLIAKSPPTNPKSHLELDSSSVGLPGTGGLLSFTPLGFIVGSCRLFSYKCPCLSKCVYSLLVLAFIAFLTNTVFNPTQKMGIMGADYSAITSAYDLSLSKVDHWCIQGDNDSCRCEDPLEPNSRSEFKSWNAAHKSNVADVNLYRAVYGSGPTMIDTATGEARPPIDVAFLGESVVEAMDGRWLGKRIVKALKNSNMEGPEAKKQPDIGKVFERLFRKDKGGILEGVALGIAGDTTANVLWRLQHDEMPYDFNPKVWWLVLGMNDLTRMQCSEEIVVLGILRVVEEIRLRKPDAKIVINSLLPMVNYQRRDQPKMADFADFRRDAKNSMRENMEVDRLRKFYNGSGGPKERKNGGPKLRRLKKNKKNQEEEKNENKKERKQEKKNEKLSDVRGKREKRKKRHGRGRNKEDDDATEGPALEKALERRKKMLEHMDKRFQNKKFRDDEKYHPKKPLSPLLPVIRKHVLPPVWPSVHLINDKLKEFCSKHESITFFDATRIFASNEGGGMHQMNSDLISPRGHPSELGFAVWEGQIMGRLHKMLMEKTAKSPWPIPDHSGKELGEDKEHPEKEELAPMTKVSVASSDLVEGSGDGTEHVSEGKESGPPPKVEQPSRSAPSEDKKAEPRKNKKGGDVKGENGGEAEDEKEPAKNKKRVEATDKKEPAKDEKEPAEDEKKRPGKGKNNKDEDEKENVSAKDKEEDAEEGGSGDDAEEGDEGDSEKDAEDEE